MWSIKTRWSLESVTSYICAILVIVGGLAACLLRGFFFTEEMYPFLTVWFVLCTVVVIFILIQGCRESRRVGEHRAEARRTGALRLGGQRTGEEGFGGNGVVCILLCCPLVVLFLYVVLWIQGPVSTHGTMNEGLRWGLYGSFAFLAYFSARNQRTARLLMAGWSMVGMVISLGALLVVCGLLKFPFAVAYSHSTEVSVTGARLGGLLEYPNTFGAVMAVFLVERLFAAATYYARTERCVRGMMQSEAGEAGEAGEASEEWSGRGVGAERSEAGEASKEWSGRGAGAERSETGEASEEWSGRRAGAERSEAGEASEEWSGRGVGAERGKAGSTAAALLRLLPLFPYAAALLLSESRGAWLAAASACAAALIWKRQLIAPLLAAGAAPVAAAALLYRQLARAGLAVEPLPGLLWLAGLWAGALLAGLWLCRRQRSAAGSARAAMLALAAVGWTAAGTAVLLHVRERITGPSSTVSARGLFYRDAWRLAAEAPWLGRGGDTWRSSYLAIQSRPYVGSQVHNGYLDILLNLGIVGLAAILLMLLATGWLLATTSPRLVPPFLVIILHSAVDFDWSYGLVWLLLFWLPALAFAIRLTTANPPAAVYPTSATQPPAVYRTPEMQPPTISHTPATPPLADRITTPVRFHVKQWFATVACCVCLMLVFLSFHAEKGVLFYQKALRASEPAVKQALLQQSLAWNPLSVQPAVELSRMLSTEQGVSVLRRSLIHSPENANLSWAMAERLMSGDKPGAALYWIRRSIRLDIYNKAKRLKAIEGMLAMGERKMGEGNLIEAVNCAVTGEELLRQYRLLAMLEGSKGKRFNDRRFGITEQTADLSRRLNEMRVAANPIGGEYNSSRLPTEAVY